MNRKIYQLVIVFIFVVQTMTPLFAEVLLDGTMGTAGEIKGPNYTIRGEYGKQAGTNLFHSFETFNIGTNETATFSGPQSIQNIISRVTGAESLIDGTLRSGIEGANFYLINPAGVMFGPNAALDISGSFHVSTADYLKMGENERFYASNSYGDQILSVAAPSAFGFLDNQIASVTFEGKQYETAPSDSVKGLQVEAGNTMSIIGGDIGISGNFYTDPVMEKDVALGNLSAPNGTVHMASVASAGEVTLSASGPDVSTFQNLGDISLSENALINAGGEGGGRIFIKGGNFYVEKSTVKADTINNGSSGQIDINVTSLSLNQGEIFSDTTGTGNGGDISVVSESIELKNYSKIFSDANSTATDAGNAGSVTMETKNLTLADGSIISSETSGTGMGGQVTLEISDQLSVTDGGKIFSGAMGTTADAGDGGNILIETDNITLSGQSIISSDSYGGGKGGDLTITGGGESAAESISITQNSSIFAGSVGELDDAGDAGTVNLQASEIIFTNGGKVGSESFGPGRGGDVIIDSTESVTFSGSDSTGNTSKIYTTAKSQESNAGDAGNININTKTAIFNDGGGINAATEGPGNAGVITINAETIQLDSNASLSTATSGSGNAGDIALSGNLLTLDSRASITSESTAVTNAGDAGAIGIVMSDSVLMTNNSLITTEAINGGKGMVTIEAIYQLFLADSKITTSIKNGGEDAGNIDVDPKYIILRNSRIVANAWEGRGGNIHLVAENFIQSSDSIVDASSALGIDGTVEIESPNVDVGGGLVVLPTNVLDASKWAKTPCAARGGGMVSKLILKGRDGTPTPHDDWLASPPLRLFEEDAEYASFGMTDLNGAGFGFFYSLNDCGCEDDEFGDLID